MAKAQGRTSGSSKDAASNRIVSGTRKIVLGTAGDKPLRQVLRKLRNLRSARKVILIATDTSSDASVVEGIDLERRDILARIERWAGGKAEALHWYCSHPIPAFGDRTAESLVKAGQATAVRDYLDSVATGSFS
ncbi:Uncharacterised protein [Pannonibacter phragmitetus]|uniref:Antitoxin Xre/MbcA/ParS-like toxin-binding domain-containing protein n=1 Tax=Pannonibacter phragmitetus TaxID=121719 RepID=A0A379A101_9HYPH|nr:antitoxin Xre/MbcA/ParS toxin-binding domain-containing protein [Pannonibacter phragmitetus]SUB02829.1 Uncharacterised protein [Pannonibacter phragmitetus]